MMAMMINIQIWKKIHSSRIILRRIEAVLKVMCLIPINTYIVVVFSHRPSLHVDLMQPSTMTEPSAPLGSSQCPVAAMLIARLFLEL